MVDNKSHRCEKFRQALWLFMDGTLSLAQQDEWQAHLKTCPSCREWMQQSRETLAQFRINAAADIDDMRFVRMIEKATRYPQKRFFEYRQWSRIVAAALLLAALGLAGRQVALLRHSGETKPETLVADAWVQQTDPLDFSGAAIDSLLNTMDASLWELEREQEMLALADTEFF